MLPQQKRALWRNRFKNITIALVILILGFFAATTIASGFSLPPAAQTPLPKTRAAEETKFPAAQRTVEKPKSKLSADGTETLTVPFTGGPYAATTQLAYSGSVSVMVSGVGQAAGTQWSDAFYIYSPGTPTHPTEPLNWVLAINGQHAENFIGSVPPYDSSHVYTFQLNAPGGQLTFGVGDTMTSDNTGSYTVTLGHVPGDATIIGTISVGSEPIGIAANSNTNRIYVNNYDSNTVLVINGQTDTVAATVPVGTRPYWGIGVSRSTGYVYSVNNGSSTVSVIDPVSSSVINTITAGVGSQPEGLTFNTRQNLLYVPNSTNRVSVISDLTAGGSVVGSISTNQYNHLMVVNERTERGYVSLSGAPASVAVLDVSNSTTLTHIPISGVNSGFGLAVNETTNRVYIAHDNENKLTVINGDSNAIITQIATGNGPVGVAVNELNNHVYVTNYLADTLSIIDGTTNTILQTLTVGDGPHGVAVNPNTAKVYVANRYGNTVTVIQDGIPPTQQVSPPQNLTAHAGVSSIALAWDSSLSNNIASYRIYRSTFATSGFTRIADGVLTTNYVDSAALTAGTTYYYYVTAYDTANESIPSNTASAAFGQLELWIPQLHSGAGASVAVPINIANANGLSICALDLVVNYSSAVVTAQSVAQTPLTAGYQFSANTTTPGTARIALASGSGTSLYGSGTLVNLNVNVSGSVGASTPLTFVIAQTDVYACSDLYHPVGLTLSNGSFTVSANYQKGDLNGDGNVNAADAALALQIAAGIVTPTDVQRAAGDVNGDGQITAADATLILYYVTNGNWGAAPSLKALTRRAGTTVTLGLPDVQARPGDTIDVPLSASAVTGMAGVDVKIGYDPTLLEVVDAQTGALASGFTLVKNTATPGVLSLALSKATASSGSGALILVKFRVRATAAEGTVSPLTLLRAQLNDIHGLDFSTSALQQTIQTQNGRVTATNNPVTTPTATVTNTPTRTVTTAPTATPTATLGATATPTATPDTGCTAKPVKPALAAPKNKATVKSTRPLLKWNAAACADTYNVTVKNAGTGKVAQKQTGLTALEFQTKKLTRGKTYKWFVQACNAIGCAKSVTRQFKVK